ncbi:hypothetical protein ACMU_00255 [Actibacterium mucosum KCTC 23349]|uniref:Transglycosylase SLT domain-containing protein n=1 Tax=Actibacterium mucosum KCTC 23349 TaxID=1454373 RepID=A0A037ZQ55_9RHOB|nr:lytic transglycosylase domain-containing protein [Actibacterium mucosum]KAJ56957.1 hypothetical protein ACMU_00255 [Actibacterium mucosum KCTC 23349]
MRWIILIWVSLWAPIAGAQQTSIDLRPVMAAVRADEWDIARALARPQGQVVRDIVEWRALRAGIGDFGTYLDFLDRNAQWPGLDRVRANAEATLTADIDAQTVIRFFRDEQPVTGIGGLRLAQAFAAMGLEGDAAAQAVITWRTRPLDDTAHATMLQQFGSLLADHHQARMDSMLWAGAASSARRMMPLVSEDWQKLAEARLALRGNQNGVDARIEAVPDALRADPGLAYERFAWRMRKGRVDDAISLLDAQSIAPETLGQPQAWAAQRRVLARRLMRDGQFELAYRLAAGNFLTEGAAYADLEWLAGFIALRLLDEPKVALAHFLRFETAVGTPISLGRAGYWQGRAYERLGAPEQAQAAYAKGGQYQTSFYGQLAAEKAGLAPDPALVGGPLPDWKSSPFTGTSALQATQLFLNAGERNLAEWFLTHLAEDATPGQQAQIAALAFDLEEPHIALRVAKVAASDRVVLPKAYFPLTDLAAAKHPVPTELVLAIARRESEFDPGVTSGAGARGLMQLMPGTAKQVSGNLNLDYRPGALLTDPEYNAVLGGAYLAELIEEFGNNYVLVSAAYNAGPSRPKRWIERFGDPRSAGVDVIDWIEFIPFTETRNYVMRVTESLFVYRARLDGQVGSLALSRELKQR